MRPAMQEQGATAAAAGAALCYGPPAVQAHLSTRGRTLKAVAAVLQACCAEDDGEEESCD
ncbi:hypothetical protein HaLaN_13473 [Haematococcus lacustris]|uniref:Uncharacterized protein n=1 Tax=Haematococcus lacustris TaxID=44745 RepID=A0A699ZCD2_HAELA|nr:hypothetical protein HaLaN_13473 [Haematococcus lacustris]